MPRISFGLCSFLLSLHQHIGLLHFVLFTEQWPHLLVNLDCMRFVRPTTGTQLIVPPVQKAVFPQNKGHCQFFHFRGQHEVVLGTLRLLLLFTPQPAQLSTLSSMNRIILFLLLVALLIGQLTVVSAYPTEGMFHSSLQ